MTSMSAAWQRMAVFILLLLVEPFSIAAAPSVDSINLDRGWRLESSCVAPAGGAQISSLSYHSDGWIDALVPGTVLGSQVAAGIFPDPFYGMNLRAIPGTDYPITKIFGYLPMSPGSPYRCSWWYRTRFIAPTAPGKSTWLHFDGINYRANIWLNGKQIATDKEVRGAFRSYDFDVSKEVSRGEPSVLAVEIFAQSENDLGIDFLDWNPAPADKSLGLWRGVSLMTTGAVTVRNPAVTTHFTNDDLSQAELHVLADIENSEDHPVTALVLVEIGSIHLQQSIHLGAKQERSISFDADGFPALRVKNPHVWWPYQYGEPHLEQLRMDISVDGIHSDGKTVHFGIREITSALSRDSFLQFQINHRSILIRGGGWTPDLFYRESQNRLSQELAYAKDMRLNTIRLEGKLGSDDLFDLADEMGILVMAGWQCCDAWQQWNKWTPADHTIAISSTYSQISRLRSHPSLLVWLNGSDEVPSLQVESEFLAVLKERAWPNPILSTAADRTSTLTGKSGVKMTGPYDYVPPEYWYMDKDRLGGAFGFNTETSPGPAIPTAASIRRTLPKASWWPIDEQWKYHAGLGKFAQYNQLTNAMIATYGEASTLESYSFKAQLMAYDAERAMFEAYGANKYRATGVIQWMLNNAWPSFIWHLYDYYLAPGGGYFGTKKANEALHIQYRYDDRFIAVINSTLTAYIGLRARSKVVGLDGKELFTRDAELSISADGAARVFSIPAESTTTFLKLELRDKQGHLMSQNFYWLPAQLAQLDWEKSTYVNTPALRYADMRDLAGLPQVEIDGKVTIDQLPGELSVRLRNNGSAVAFFIYLRAVRSGTDEDITPVFWNDNFVSLLPGESRVLTVSGLPSNAEIKLIGWNARPRTLTTRSAED